MEIYGNLGLDFVRLDFEHAGVSPWDSTVFENPTRAAEPSNVELLGRIPEPNPSLVRKVLDSGVRNHLVPRVDVGEDVRAVVEATQFVYDGSAGDLAAEKLGKGYQLLRIGGAGVIGDGPGTACVIAACISSPPRYA